MKTNNERIKSAMVESSLIIPRQPVGPVVKNGIAHTLPSFSLYRSQHAVGRLSDFSLQRVRSVMPFSTNWVGVCRKGTFY